ncbi:NtaA/DmoA family FMN-dependent monooxygenase [Saccharopolyspora sp. K220]|uniref:NtaA/DmoA family FMN-dependent monooxygenase n=1 Tax=Saccharopolyspora soli TaxID=2926618 RepID=UPI001F591675|nr:NtaA/DmoA family FMN-dependent monooxygenase [Saccharopolyspora soli]MCI2419765.1 NtaA/DmoA family FMN-dependent monooxygenase [Saccharopolyspora soli]
MPTRRLHLNVGINSTGYAASSWAWPGTRWNRFADFEHYLHAAKLARDGVFDAVFLSDHTALQRDATSRPLHSFDPVVLFSALAATVPDIGFVLTASTSYNSPYNLARRLASLDTISGGRLVWNVVSSFNPDIAANFGSAPLPARADRYRRADEFLSVVKKLWLSWDTPGGPAPEEFLWTAETARRIDHHGEFFDVAGPLNVPIGPQGHPVISQAGASAAGIDLAGKHAELVYAALLGKQAAARHGAAIRERAIAHRRDPETVRLLPGLVPIIGDTREEALRRHEALHGSAGEDGLLASLFRRTGMSVDPDVPLDPSVFAWDEGQDGAVGFVRSLAELTADEKLTARQLVRRTEGGHRLLVGTARDVADGILDWWADGTVDGFTVQPPVLPDDLARFVAEVVPLLQAEGAYPREYREPTIRGRFALPVPVPPTGAAAVGVSPVHP